MKRCRIEFVSEPKEKTKWKKFAKKHFPRQGDGKPGGMALFIRSALNYVIDNDLVNEIKK